MGFILGFMMTSIEIGSVNDYPALCLGGSVLDLRQEKMLKYSSFLFSVCVPVAQD
jgi:hypothetical protein